MNSSLLLAVVLIATSMGLLAQDPPKVPSRWGLHLGLNYNLSGIGFGYWVPDPNRPSGQFTTLVLNDGSGIGLYGGLNYQTALSDGIHLGARLSYDNRGLVAKDNQSYKKPDGTYFSDEYTFHNGFLTLEPFIKLYLGKQFHLTGGLGMGLALAQTFDYAPEGGSKIDGISVGGPTDSLKHTITWSGFAGFGYDIYLSDAQAKQQWILTPFVEASYMVSQRGVDLKDQASFDDALSTVTIRAGISLAFGDAVSSMAAAPVAAPTKFFRVTPPADGIYSKRVEKAEFPLRPFVFINKNETQIPSRYTAMMAGETADFGRNTGLTADDLANVQERPFIQKEIYYHILNIMGYRLKNTPGSSMELYASDPDGKDPKPYAEDVKRYLVDVWGVSPDQLAIATGDPDPRSGTPRTPADDVPFTLEENRRVQLRKFNPDALGRRVPISVKREAEKENQIYTEITTNENIVSWQATLSGNGQKRSFGPFTSRSMYMDPTGLLATNQPSGQFTMEVVAKTADGRTLSDTEPFTLTRTASEGVSQRYRLVFNYAEEDPVGRSKDYLMKEIAPNLTSGAKVVIYGHTDNLGKDATNLDLSNSRANEVKKILQDAASSRGLSGVTITAKGMGENEPPFGNELPEGRMYNRTVIIDVIP
ncbi:MAG: OmpA family protein [Candidatus Kapabacteria bacterium]|nr:OmpA family protein [Candidatus Kapabacteria bacterium]